MMSDDFAEQPQTPVEPPPEPEDEAPEAGVPDEEAPDMRETVAHQNGDEAFAWDDIAGYALPGIEAPVMTVSSGDEDQASLLAWDGVATGEQPIYEPPVVSGTEKAALEPAPPLWERILRQVWPTQAQRNAEFTERMATLDDAIEAHPEGMSNYVMRGELLLELGRLAEAIEDLERGEALATQEFAERRWGVVAQTLRDRARRRLETARKQLRARGYQAE